MKLTPQNTTNMIAKNKTSQTTTSTIVVEPVLVVVFPRKLVHSGKKRAYPSHFVWDCPKCKKWNIWQTSKLFGCIKVTCQECNESFNLDKSKPELIITRTKKMKSIID